MPVLTIISGTVSFAAVSFNRDIRPIMSDTCFRCHGPDKSSRMAGMRLDIREEALKPTKDGVIPIVPGDPDHSAIIAARVRRQSGARDAAELHPQGTDRRAKGHHPPLGGRGREIRRPLGVSADPAARGSRNGQAAGADPQSHRRLHPGSPGARRPHSFARSRPAHTHPPRLARSHRPAAHARRNRSVRQRQIAQCVRKGGGPPARHPQRYAEQQAMHWLDAVRYADTCGFHGDNIFPAWPYRDYVLRAFRDNKPFDEFTREQLAGDLMPNATLEQRIASAYNRLNRTSAEGGLQPKEYLAKYAADRARTLSAVWLASTTRLRRVPRSQVRSLPLARFLFDEGVLRRYRRDRPGAG